MYPLLYHAQHQSHKEDLPFWLSMAQRYGDPILELGCGTGRVLIPLAKNGFRCTGIDNQSEMLQYLDTQLKKNQQVSDITIKDMDITGFKISNSFRLVILPCNTYSTFQAQYRNKILNNVQLHLRPSGKFVFSMPNPGHLLQIPSEGDPELEETFMIHGRESQEVRLISSWHRKPAGEGTPPVIHFLWEYQVHVPGGSNKTLKVSTQHFLDPVGTYLAELNNNGFHIVQTFGDFNQSPFSEESTYLIVIAELMG